MPEFLSAFFGASENQDSLTLVQVTFRAILIYAVLIILIRFGKKRFLSRATAMDAVIVITIGSIASRGITGNAPLSNAVVSVAVLIGAHWFLSYILHDSPRLGSLLKGEQTILIKDGVVDQEALKAEHMSKDDLAEDLRQNGIQNPSDVKMAALERSGDLSVIKK